MRGSLALLLALLAIINSTFAVILAIDYGTEWMKASLMKPGMPLDVLLNKDSKRKIQSTVGWKGQDRLFGVDAFNLAARFPRDSFSSLKGLQGRTVETDAVSFFAAISTTDIVDTPRKTIAFRRSDDSEWSVEELIAMQFAYVKELAEVAAGNSVHDVVVTVPPYYSTFERQAVLDAIEIAGLKPLSLINDGAAVAVNFAMTRSFPTPETHIVYDAGAGSIRATVVTFSSVAPDPKSTISSQSKGNATIVEVKSIGYVRDVGGNELNRRLRDILVDDFNAKHQKDIRKDARGMAKMWKEAGRIKTVLSANAQASSTVESVAFDIDYRAKILRSTFEEALIDLKPSFTKPIVDALSNAGLTLGNITSIILMGGASRTPIVQQSVRDLVGDAKIAQNVNTDEAAVLGAVFYGATISSQFKTKDIRLQDIGPYDIQISYPSDSKIPGVRPRTISTLLFPIGSKYNFKKTLTLKRKEDFALTFSYKLLETGAFPSDISKIDIIGVSEALGNLTERGAVDPVIKVTVGLTESGLPFVEDAIAFGEIKDDSIAGKLKGLFGSSSSSEESSATETLSSTDTSAAASASISPDKKKTTKEKGQDTIRLTLEISPLSIQPLSRSEKFKSKQRLLSIERAEGLKRQREESFNLLEAYLYRLRDLLDSDMESSFIQYSKEKERKDLSDLLDSSFHWVSESGESAEQSEILAKKDALETLERPIKHRIREAKEIREAVINFEAIIKAGEAFLESARQNYTQEEPDLHRYTLEELDEFNSDLQKQSEWLNKTSAKQQDLAKNEDPVLLTFDVNANRYGVESVLRKFLKRKAPKPKKTTTSTTSTSGEREATTVTTETETTTSMASSTTSPTGHDEL